SFDQALRIKPDSSAWNNRGISLGYLGRYEEAIASFDQALKIKPDSPAWYNRGLTLHKLERYEEAISSYDKAIEFKPDMHEALVNKGNILVKLKRDTEAIKFYESALNCIDPQWWEAWNKNQSLANIYALNKEAVVKTSVKGINTVHIVTLNEQGSSSKLPLEKLKKLQDYMRHQPSLFSDLSEAKKSYEEALEFLTFDKFPEQHLQLLQELLKVYSSDNPEEFQKNLEKGTQQLEKLLRNKSEQERIKLDSKFAAFNQMRVDILAQSEDPEKHIEALKTAEVRKNTCLAWLREGSIYQPPTEEFEFKQTQKLLNPKTAAIYWHLSPIGITTFIIKHNEPLKILSPQLPSESQQGDSRPHFYQLQRFESWMQQEWKITSYSSTSYSSKDKPLP
ncbi:tetratricopeptide repeat protein, partial [uncultured Nostoc sp.]|uniref:tetratricopeptide repeat protein n=1 Tax=uncultured Nostoc sp. TaxID=340711 RepID=UPI0035C963BE